MDGPHGLAVTARDFGLRGPRGWAFRGVRVDAEPGALIAIEGPSGSGRTCLLLALTGRMRPTDGTATVGGLRLPRQMSALRRISALAHVPGVTDLEPALTVAEHLRERALLQRRFGDSVRGLLLPRAERAARARLRPTRHWTRPVSTWTRCPRDPVPPYGTWSARRHCGCRSPWR